MELELLLDSLLGCQTFLESKGVGLGDDRNDVDDVRQLLEDNNVNGFQTAAFYETISYHGSLEASFFFIGYNSRVTRGLDEKEAAVNTGILDITVTLGRKFLSEVCRVLVLDVLDDRIPTSGHG